MSTRLVDLLSVLISVALVALLIRLNPTPVELLIGILVIAGTSVGFSALNHTIGRRPKLVVEYRNPDLGHRPVFGPDSTQLLAVVRNAGKGSAEAVEVRFDTGNASYLWNESGNRPERDEVDITLQPPRFSGGTRVLGPNEEWVLARLKYSDRTPASPIHWEARAKGMTKQSGDFESRG